MILNTGFQITLTGADGKIRCRVYHNPCAWTTSEGEEMPSWCADYPSADGNGMDTDCLGGGAPGFDAAMEFALNLIAPDA